MYSLGLSHHRRANIWLDKAPTATFKASSELTRIVKPKIRINISRKLAAIEINIPYGPMASYALLGAEVVNADVEGLKVIVPINSIGSRITPSLALRSEEVRLGLLEEYASAVFAGVESLAESNGLPTNMAIRFSWAAHGSVGSSQSAFENVSRLVVRLLALPSVPSKEQIIALFD